MNQESVRKVMLEVIADFTRHGSPLASHTVVKETAKKLGVGSKDPTREQAVLTCWHDLLVSGQLARGQNLMNPDGYLAYLRERCSLDPVALSYVAEALKCYNANCFKAAAVMAGAAAERLVLRLRDTLESRLTACGKTMPKGLTDWKMKAVRDALAGELEAHKRDMPGKLVDAFGTYWLALAEQIRRGRDDAGHPQSVDPVTPESVHAALLIFPELARLIAELESWADTFYVPRQG
jgi:hypothetical protein